MFSNEIQCKHKLASQSYYSNYISRLAVKRIMPTPRGAAEPQPANEDSSPDGDYLLRSQMKAACGTVYRNSFIGNISFHICMFINSTLSELSRI